MKAYIANQTASRWGRPLAQVTAMAVATGSLAWLVLAGGASVAADGPAVAVADEAPGYIVEDFAYPLADKILAEQRILLKRGDGHIVLADCASGTGLIEVWARRLDNKKICFRVTGNSGWLTMEIPAVHSIKGNDYTTEVDMTVGSEKKSFDILKNEWTSVGESADEQGREHMLVEIRTAK
ncbi:mannose/fructose-specific phosphotransferase system component IIA [Streptomyces sp. HB372]|nr:mannose/fructose-specific phosphotransferase system component IIA [Streptomyces sp. HB372]